MKQLILSEQQVMELRNYLMEQPTKMALPVLQMLEKLFIEQNPVTEPVIEPVEEVKEPELINK
jgi:hypothetical protein